MIQVNQDEYMRMLNLLNYQADFILKNTDVNKITKEKPFNSESEKNIRDYLNMCNDLGLVFDEYIAAKEKYYLSDEYLAELNKTKKQLDDFVFANFPVEELVGDRHRRRGGC